MDSRDNKYFCREGGGVFFFDVNSPAIFVGIFEPVTGYVHMPKLHFKSIHNRMLPKFR